MIMERPRDQRSAEKLPPNIATVETPRGKFRFIGSDHFFSEHLASELGPNCGGVVLEGTKRMSEK